MAEELEELWKKLTVTEEENEDIVLGSNSTRVAKEVGKNCIVMKVLTQRCVSVDALKKNLRMLWKPNKGLQVAEIEDNLFLAEFGDSRDKKKVMEMRPWSFEKQLMLMREFEGELIPKEIVLKWSPFWIQIYNLPLKCMTSGTGNAIGAKIGEVLEVDVPENGVQWGKYFRVRVNVDTTKKLVRGKKINIEECGSRWVYFKYERLPNFCYRCGMLDHGEKECLEQAPVEESGEKGNAQYGPWLRGEPGRRANKEVESTGEGGRLNNKHKDEGFERGMRNQPGKSTAPDQQTENGGVTAARKSRPVGLSQRPNTEVSGVLGESSEGKHENGNEKFQGEKNAGMLYENSIGNMNETKKHEDTNMGSPRETATREDWNVSTGLENSNTEKVSEVETQVSWAETNTGPLAMCYETNKGWIEEKLGPTSRHWKRLARTIKNTSPSDNLVSAGVKRGGPVSVQELDPNTLCAKKGKGKSVECKTSNEEDKVDGGVAVAARQHRRAQ